MNDMKSIFGQVLDTPAPPMTPADQLLGAAHRAAHRRRLIRVAWSGAAAVGLTALAATALSAATAGQNPDHTAATPPSGTAPAATRSASGSTVPSTGATGTPSGKGTPPPGKAPATRSPAPDEPDSGSGPRYAMAKAALGKLINLLPAGYTTPTTQTIQAEVDGRRERVQVQGVQVSDDGYVAITDVYRDGMGGSVTVTVDTGSRALKAGADLCGQEVWHQGVDDGCHVITTASGVRVRVSWSSRLVDGRTSRIYYAAAVYDGVTVQVQETQFGGMAQLNQLTQPVFTEAQLADVAATADFKP